jgi:replication factor C large subunit
MVSNTKNTKLKTLVRLSKVVEFDRVHPSLLLLYLNQILQVKGIDMQLRDKIDLIKSAKGDIRALLNIVQAKISGYDAARYSPSVIDISQVISDFFNSPTIEGAKQILMRADGGYSDPRFGQSSEERRKDIIYAFFSSILTSDIESGKVVDALNVLSKCDVIVGRVSKDRHWTLLKYIHDILSYGLFTILTGQKVKYNQYSLPWPISAPIIARRLGLREILVNLAHRTRTSVSTFSATYLPYLLLILLSQKVDLQQFVGGLGLDPKAAESLLKEITSLKVSKK